MPQRLVVSFRGVVRPEPGGGQSYLQRAIALKKRAEALGATLCAWSAQTFSFDFDPSELEEAVVLAMHAFEGPVVEARLGAGIAEGEMRAIGDAGSLAVLSWGPPLVAAVALSRQAEPGEVRIEPELLVRREAELAELAMVRIDHQGQRLVPRDDTAATLALAAPTSAALPTLRNPPPLPAFPPMAEQPPAPDGDEAAPETIRGLPPEMADLIADAPLAGSLHDNEPSSPEIRESRPEPVAPLVKWALLQGDIEALERRIAELRETGERNDLVERMSSLVALCRGDAGEALRRLRDAAESVREPAQQARAHLCYGIALATVDRTDGALLEALEALARARATDDIQGERACALLLARLSDAAGHPDAASAWTLIADRCAQPAS
jgi:hypothetical protein